MSGEKIFAELSDEVEKLTLPEGESLIAFGVSTLQRESLQFLFLGDSFEVYQNRLVNEESSQLELWLEHLDADGDKCWGYVSASFDPIIALGEQLESILTAARSSFNRPWLLPDPPDEPWPEVETADEEILNRPDAVASNLLTECRSLLAAARRQRPSIHCNSAELYLTGEVSERRLSNRLETRRSRSEIYFEMALEDFNGPRDQEVHRVRRSLALSDLDLSGFFAESLSELASLGDSSLPPSSDSLPILIGVEPITDLLLSLRQLLTVQAEYEKSSHFLPGDSIFEGELAGRCEPLTLILDPLEPRMALSTPFTAEGLIARRAVVIDRGHVSAQTISARYGSYLDKEPNGICGNLIVPPGRQSRAELLVSEESLLEIISFSSLLIHPKRLTWSSEIKLAMLHRRGEPPQPIKGGVVSGALRENLADCAWSSERSRFNAPSDAWSPARGYYGPAALLIRGGVRIAGEESNHGQ